jgi:hypothetical protein
MIPSSYLPEELWMSNGVRHILLIEKMWGASALPSPHKTEMVGGPRTLKLREFLANGNLLPTSFPEIFKHLKVSIERKSQKPLLDLTILKDIEV